MKRVLLVADVPQVAEHLRSMPAREKGIQLTGVSPQGGAGRTTIAVNLATALVTQHRR